MEKKSADRIIVKSNDRMTKVLNWYADNREWLDAQEFHAPMDCGVIELQEELLELTFEQKNDIVEISVYATEKPNLPPVVTFNYDPKTTAVSNHRFAAHLTKERKDMLRLVMLSDNTDRKSALKYHILMLFMAHYREIVEVSESRERSKKEIKQIRRASRTRRAVPLVQKTYVVTEFDEKKLPSPDGKRAYTKPDHEVSVRGYLRHYKNGKTRWIAPFTKYKDKGKPSAKIYELQEVKKNET